MKMTKTTLRMKWLQRSVAVAAALCAVSNQAVFAADGPGNVFFPPTGLWVMPSNGKTPYGATNISQANWSLIQDNIPSNLPAFQLAGAGYSTSNQYGQVLFTPGSGISGGPVTASVTPIQDNGTPAATTLISTTGTIPYTGTYPSGWVGPLENNLFISPDKVSYQGSPVATGDIGATLGDMLHLYQSFSMQPGFAEFIDLQQPSTAATPTQMTYFADVTLTNPSQKQTLFYQIELGRFSAVGNSQTGTVNKMPFTGWFYTGGNPQVGTSGGKTFGYDDSIANYNVADASSNAKVTYQKRPLLWANCQPTAVNCANLDLLPQLKKVIANGKSYGVDQNLSDWKVGGAYVGQATWGHVRTETTWTNYSLTVM